MVENLSVISGFVKWNYDSNNIVLEINDVFFATEHEESKLIQIDSGKNFVASKVYYYSYEGNLELYYDLESNIIEWTYQGAKKDLTVDNMKQVAYFPQKQKLIVLCEKDGQELQCYTMKGDILFKTKQPVGFKMLYFTWTKDQVSIVCDGEENNEDAHGRFRYNFLLNIDDGKLSKGNFAY